MDGERWKTDTDDGQWAMDDGQWRTTITTTQQSNSAWETEEEDSGRRRDYDWGKEEGLHLPYKSEGGMPRRPW